MKKPSHEAMKALYYFIYTNIFPHMSNEKKLEILAKAKAKTIDSSTTKSKKAI